ncbi:uncharacterized protein VTP21DRAFT_2641 [Calcarisporiella thermophila]|uniref:uncharacterized protein n=1 Tax=Calcarisporiella thermophila TaxID=911321 RepID=UPI0037425E3C
MFRATVLRKSTAKVLTAGTITLGAGLTTTAMAEGHKQKLPIYDEPQPEYVLVLEPSRLEKISSQTQSFAQTSFQSLQSRLHSITKQWIGFEQCVEHKIKELVDPADRLVPNSIYVGVTGLAGTIIARRRGIILRALTPLLFAGVAAWYWVPGTSRNVVRELERLEKEGWPQLGQVRGELTRAVSDARAKISGAVDQLEEMGSQKTAEAREMVEKSVEVSRETMEDKAREAQQAANVKAKQAEEDIQKASEYASEETISKVESMYSTRGKPGVEESLQK